MRTKGNGHGLGIFQHGSNSEAIDDIIVKAGNKGIMLEEIIKVLPYRNTKIKSTNPRVRVEGHVKTYGAIVGIYAFVNGRVKKTKNAAAIATKIKDRGILKYREDVLGNKRSS